MKAALKQLRDLLVLERRMTSECDLDLQWEYTEHVGVALDHADQLLANLEK
jgi:hypothetical protein